jgi:hypothetical protein
MPVLEVASKWTLPEYWNLEKVGDLKHPQPYVYEQDGLRHLVWGVAARNPASDAPEMTVEERAAAKAEKRRLKLVRAAREKVRGEWGKIAEGGAKAARERLGSIFDELASRRLDREIARGFVGEDFLDDFARLTFETATAGMDKDERDAYEAALIAADEREEADGEGDGE